MANVNPKDSTDPHATDLPVEPESLDQRKSQSPKPMFWRLAPVFLIVVIAAGFFVLGLDEYISFEVICANHAELQSFVAQNLALAALVYLALYATVVAASVPGALVMTITGGLLFGTFAGTVLTLFGATIGATGVFLIARTAMGDTLRRKTGGALSRMAEGFREDAFNYLLVLRLIPIFPFFIVNLAPAFLGVPLRTFFMATFIGIAPGTFVYSSVGAGLGSVFERGEEFSAGSILTPEIVTALVGLAVLAMIPVIYRRIVAGRKASHLPK